MKSLKDMNDKEFKEHLTLAIIIITGIVNGLVSVTPESAQKLSEDFGKSPDFWLSLHKRHGANPHGVMSSLFTATGRAHTLRQKIHNSY